jgi:bifunctional DNase/RNase
VIRISVASMSLDERTGSPVVLMLVPPVEMCLPIWIGPAEAASIALALRGERYQRPLTHDLTCTIIDGLGARLDKVVITDQREGTFFGKLYLQREHELVGIDARPSDCIALALRADAPIYLAEKVLEAVRDSLLPLEVLEPPVADGEEGTE